MFDCGMHMGFNDARRFPDFSYISASGNFTQAIDCVIISHFHLDHCGALPHFTEICGYDGPIYMTYPTKAICPILLEDYRKIMVDKKGEANFFTSEMIKECMKKVTPVSLEQTIQVDEEMWIRPYYAGHVLGAAMFWIKVGELSVVYTGDFNSTADRHLGAAAIDTLRPDLLITETTYATTIRDSKRCRERDFLMQVHRTIEAGGKVLIPVFALGRAQELCLLLEQYWERMQLKVPIYVTAGLAEKANEYYKLLISWTNQKVKGTYAQKNPFDFSHIGAFDKSMTNNPGPMVLFATPGMLHAGTSLEVFKAWCGDARNMVILPGYCVAGTVGNKLLSLGSPSAASPKQLHVDRKTTVDVRCAVKHLSFSAHADAKGIMNLIRQVGTARWQRGPWWSLVSFRLLLPLLLPLLVFQCHHGIGPGRWRLPTSCSCTARKARWSSSRTRCSGSAWCRAMTRPTARASSSKLRRIFVCTCRPACSPSASTRSRRPIPMCTPILMRMPSWTASAVRSSLLGISME
jgi:integrator complex subunit 11